GPTSPSTARWTPTRLTPSRRSSRRRSPPASARTPSPRCWPTRHASPTPPPGPGKPHTVHPGRGCSPVRFPAGHEPAEETTVDIDHGTDRHPVHHRADVRTTDSAADPTAVDTLAYPISPDYVKSWTSVRGLCELIANALDEDRDATVAW